MREHGDADRKSAGQQADDSTRAVILQSPMFNWGTLNTCALARNESNFTVLFSAKLAKHPVFLRKNPVYVRDS
jgi:hypothetical protein